MDVAIDSSMGVGYVDAPISDGMMMGMEETGSGLTGQTVLIIVIAVCAILGIVAGILLGRRSALK